jgi:hypothetical protein
MMLEQNSGCMSGRLMEKASHFDVAADPWDGQSLVFHERQTAILYRWVQWMNDPHIVTARVQRIW